MPIRAVVFDLFDTLVDLPMEDIPCRQFNGRPMPEVVYEVHSALCGRVEIDFERFAVTLREVDSELRRSHTAQGLEISTHDRFAALIERLRIDDARLPDVMTDVYMAGVREQVRLVDHHPAVLASLRQRFRTGLCSNFTHAATAVEIVEEAALRPHLDALVISETVGFRKPRPEIFEATLRELDVAAAEVVHVGDSLRADVGGAAALGIRTAWITRRISDIPGALGAHEGPRPDWQISDLAELPALLQALAAER